VPGLPSAWSFRPRGRHALAVTRSAARGLIAPVAARAAAARAGTHTSHDATAWGRRPGPRPRGVRDAGQIARLATLAHTPCTKHKINGGDRRAEWHPGDDDESITIAISVITDSFI
jgi:hypothetical protein